MPFITCVGDAFTATPSANAAASFKAMTSAAYYGRLTLSLLSSEYSTQFPLPTDAVPLPNEVVWTTTKVSGAVTDIAQRGRAGVWVHDGTVTSVGKKVKTDNSGTFDCMVGKTHLHLWLFADSTGKGENQANSPRVLRLLNQDG